MELLVEIIRVFEAVESHFSPAFIRAYAARFDRPNFEAKIIAFISQAMAEFQERQPGEQQLARSTALCHLRG